MLVGRKRTVPGVETPIDEAHADEACRELPRPFGVGEPVAYVQAPKAKGYRSLSIGFRTPRLWVLGLFAGAHRRRFPESSGWSLVLMLLFCKLFPYVVLAGSSAEVCLAEDTCL